MAIRTIRHGETQTLNGALTNGGTLVIAGAADPYGTAGSGVIGPTGELTNIGLIVLKGGFGGSETHGDAGASLINDGVLINFGTIEGTGGFGLLTSYNMEGLPSQLINSSYLVNAGTLALFGGAGKYTSFPHYVEGAMGATLNNSGVLSNFGLLTVGGGRPGDFGSYLFGPGPGDGRGAVLENTGSIDNTGTIALSGGVGSVREGMYAYGGGGGGLIDTGVLMNAGLLDIGGGGAPPIYGGDGGDGGFVTIYGTLVNSGAIISEYGFNDTPGTLTVAKGGTLVMAGGTVSGQVITNEGTIDGFGVISTDRSLSDATVIASGGLLTFSGGLNSFAAIGGSYLVTNGATLALTGRLSLSTPMLETATLSSGGTLEVVAATAKIPVLSATGGTLLLEGGGSATLNAADAKLSVFLLQESTLTLSQGTMVFATGSSGADRLTAGAAGQTLTGRLGADTLVGAAATGDTFKDTSAGLNGDTIGGFAGTDTIDITDLAAGPGLSLSYVPGGSSGVLSVAEGGKTSKITLSGSFTSSSFTTASDGHGGVLIGLH